MAATDASFPSTAERGILDRILSLFSYVKPGEGAGALLLAVNLFVLLAAYYILKPVREALILSEAGAEVKSYASAAQAVLFLLIVPLYGAFASKVNRVRLGRMGDRFFISPGDFLSGGTFGERGGVAYYIWVGIFNYLVIAQFWALPMTSIQKSKASGFPIIGMGASIGAVFGAVATRQGIKTFGPYL
jgi:AAA family ATP:ADP antiporter